MHVIRYFPVVYGINSASSACSWLHSFYNSMYTIHLYACTHTHTHTQNQPGAQQSSVTFVGQRPPNKFILSFLALCLCSWCWPALVFAILGIIYSIQVYTQQHVYWERNTTCTQQHVYWERNTTCTQQHVYWERNTTCTQQHVYWERNTTCTQQHVDWERNTTCFFPNPQSISCFLH